MSVLRSRLHFTSPDLCHQNSLVVRRHQRTLLTYFRRTLLTYLRPPTIVRKYESCPVCLCREVHSKKEINSTKLVFLSATKAAVICLVRNGSMPLQSCLDLTRARSQAASRSDLAQRVKVCWWVEDWVDVVPLLFFHCLRTDGVASPKGRAR